MKANTKTVYLCLGAFLAASVQGFGMYNIHTVSGITEGGVLGAILLLNHWTGLSPAISSLILNTGCYILGWRRLGKKFLLFSFAATAGYSVGYGISEQFPPVYPQIASMPLAAAILGSLFVGICTGICVRIGGAASGDDALAMSLSSITSIPIQWIYLSSDVVVLLLSLTYIPVRKIAYSLLTVVLSGQIIGLVQKGNRG